MDLVLSKLYHLYKVYEWNALKDCFVIDFYSLSQRHNHTWSWGHLPSFRPEAHAATPSCRKLLGDEVFVCEKNMQRVSHCYITRTCDFRIGAINSDGSDCYVKHRSMYAGSLTDFLSNRHRHHLQGLLWMLPWKHILPLFLTKQSLGSEQADV